jgi:hypothetical protein
MFVCVEPIIAAMPAALLQLRGLTPGRDAITDFLDYAA